MGYLFYLSHTTLTADFTMHIEGAEMAGIPVLEAPVLIVGGSMVGMTLSALLAKHGIRDCISVERHKSTAIHPRAALFHPRTMQIYRELGLYEQMKEESYKHYDKRAGLYKVESLAATLKGGEVGTWMKDINQWIENISPTSRLFLTQQMFEPLLRKHATEHGADLRFSTELVDFQQDDDGVTALVRNVETGEKHLVRTQYMVACDGNRSFVRKKLGIGIRGHGLLSHSLTIYFNANLSKFVEGRYNGVIYVSNDIIRGFFRLDKTGREGFLVVNTYGERGTTESRYPGEGITNEKAGEMLRAAIGTDVEFEITLLSPWRAVCDVAEQFVSGRVLLAGDAAHTVVPNVSLMRITFIQNVTAKVAAAIFSSKYILMLRQGGFGGNSGIQDAHNLAWKLALVLQNKADQDLVSSTYQDERWPVARKTIDQVFERYIVRTDPELKDETTEVETEVPEPHLELGYRYHSRALTTSGLQYVTEDPATAKAVPGSMAHHVFIATTSQDSSSSDPFPIADILGDSFVFLCGHDALAWLRAARNFTLEEAIWLPKFKTHQLSPQTDPKFYDKYAISPKGCVLIRPDGFIAWSERNQGVHGRGGFGTPDPEAVLKCVMREILCFDPPIDQRTAYSTSSSSTVNEVASAEQSLAAKLFRQTQELEHEKDALLTKVKAIDLKLADLKCMSELQDKMAMLSMKFQSKETSIESLQLSDAMGYDLRP